VKYGERSTPFQGGLFVNIYFWKWLRYVRDTQKKDEKELKAFP